MKGNGSILAAFLLLLLIGCRQPPVNEKLVNRTDSLAFIAERIALDFPFTENEIDQQLKEKIGAFNAEEIAEWEKKNWLEWKLIGGEKRYFSRAVSNLQLIRSFHNQRAQRDSLEAADPEMIFRKKHTLAIINASEKKPDPVNPVSMTINYT